MKYIGIVVGDNDVATKQYVDSSTDTGGRDTTVSETEPTGQIDGDTWLQILT